MNKIELTAWLIEQIADVGLTPDQWKEAAHRPGIVWVDPDGNEDDSPSRPTKRKKKPSQGN